MKKLLTFAALSEAATGVALMAGPLLVGRLLLGVELTELSILIARVAGIGLFSLGLACWPRKDTTYVPQHFAILTYNLLVTLYLLYVCIRGEWVGPLLWPAVVLHAVLALLLARAWFHR